MRALIRRTSSDGSDVYLLLEVHDRYRALVGASLELLQAEDPEALLDAGLAAGLRGWEGRGANARPVPVGVGHLEEARVAVLESLRRSSTASSPARSGSAVAVEGVDVAGAWWVGDGVLELTGDEIARRWVDPLEGAALASSTVPTRSAPRTVAADWIRGRLPVGRWKRYQIRRGADGRLLVAWGKFADRAAVALGMVAP
jgi:hypothetical protein